MIKSDKKFIFAFFLILVILISGCKSLSKVTGSKDTKAKTSMQDIRTGTDGISVSFLPNNPPDTIHLDSTNDKNDITVVVQLDNKGAYPQPGVDTAPSGKIYLSGYDKNIIIFDDKSLDGKNSLELNKLSLYGKSPINLNGGSDLATFKGKLIPYEELKVEKYEPILLATVCYNYVTIAGPTVCIDPDPYSTTNQKKVCNVHDITLTGQGAPVAVVSISEEAFAKKTQFKITIKNVGNGDVIKTTAQQSGISDDPRPANSVDKCDPYGSGTGTDNKITREDIDKVYLAEVSIGQQSLTCYPFSGENVKGVNGFIRLLNGQGSVICEYEKTDSGYAGGTTAYTTPLRIVLTYVYKTTAQRPITIMKESIIS